MKKLFGLISIFLALVVALHAESTLVEEDFSVEGVNRNVQHGATLHQQPTASGDSRWMAHRSVILGTIGDVPAAKTTADIAQRAVLPLQFSGDKIVMEWTATKAIGNGWLGAGLSNQQSVESSLVESGIVWMQVNAVGNVFARASGITKVIGNYRAGQDYEEEQVGLLRLRIELDVRKNTASGFLNDKEVFSDFALDAESAVLSSVVLEFNRPTANSDAGFLSLKISEV